MSAQFYLLRISMSLEPGDIVLIPEWVFFMAAREEETFICQGVSRDAMVKFAAKIGNNWEFEPLFNIHDDNGQRCVSMLKRYPPDRRRFERVIVEDTITFDPSNDPPIQQTIKTKEIDHGETYRYVKRPPYTRGEWNEWKSRD